MTTALSLDNPELDKALALLVDIASAGARCPATCGPDAHSLLRSEHIVYLAKRGDIRSEISGRNWRQITILTGPHAGKKTAPNPNEKARVWRTMDANGVEWNTIARGHEVSAPRPLSAAELAS
jgi:hypothetical protein